MRRLIFLFMAVCLLYALCFGGSSPGKDSIGWKKLKKVKMIRYVKVYDDPEKTIGPGKAKRYILEMTLFRKLLEKAGITETVILELHSRYKGRKIAKLGKFEPTIETTDGEIVIKFDSIPGEKKIYVALKDFIRKQAHQDMMDDMRFLLPDPATLVVKNAKKKIKAWVKIIFLYTSR